MTEKTDRAALAESHQDLPHSQEDGLPMRWREPDDSADAIDRAVKFTKAQVAR